MAQAAGLQFIADFPPGSGPFPTMILAPGQGYHMRLPAMTRTAKALVDQGMAVYRFDWSYFTAEPKGNPSADLSSELRDMQEVIATARRDERVDPDRVSWAASRWALLSRGGRLLLIRISHPQCC